MKPVDGFELAHNSIRFSYLPNSPFRDERVRKATSLLLDRDLSIETINETRRFIDAGFDIEQRWNSALICGEPWWMDPRSKEFGSESKVYTYDPAEAKKLMRAAGHTSALKTVLGIRNEQPTEYEREAQIMHGMWTAHGDFDLQFQVRDYRSDWRDKVHFGSNAHEGIAFGFFQSTFPDVDLVLLSWYMSGQTRTGHVDASGKPDAYMDGLIQKQRVETDNAKRMEILREFQRYAARTMYTYMGAGDSTRFELGQPWLGNWGVYRTSATDSGAPATEVFPYMYIKKQG
jgi:ABC-type transport system substrate-binding protein